MSHLPPPHCPGTWFYKFSIRWPSWADLRFKPMGDDCLLPPTFPSSHLSLSRKLKTYTPLPASGCPLTVALDSDRTVGQPGLSPVPNPLVPWGCLDQSCKRLTAGGSSIRTRITWRSSVPRSPGGEAHLGPCITRVKSVLPGLQLEPASWSKLRFSKVNDHQAETLSLEVSFLSIQTPVVGLITQHLYLGSGCNPGTQLSSPAPPRRAHLKRDFVAGAGPRQLCCLLKSSYCRWS